MNEIYWLTVIGNLHNIIITIFVILIFLMIASIASFFIYILTEDETEEENKSFLNFFKKIGLSILCTGIVLCFIPSKEDMLVIYGIGGTIDYIQSNDKAKELPDKVVDALTTYLEHVNDDKNKDESK